MEIFLKEIDANNWEECTKLKVHDEQTSFVAPNWYSIIEANFESSFIPRAVYLDNKMIGFFMCGKDPADNKYWVVRLMIDKHVQGKGLGRKTLLKGISFIRDLPDCSSEIITSYKPNNEVARKLYENLGFIDTGHIIDGEVVVSLPLK